MSIVPQPAGTADVAPGRLDGAVLSANFTDLHPPLSFHEAHVEADRCYFCFDAPCLEACPTGIDIPGFIRKISTDNVKGAAVTILSENIMGGACARVCPVEILCEAACVREAQEAKPVQIGALQRYATDWLFDHKLQPFKRGAATGKRIAVVGAGPAGLACAHRLALRGHEVTVFEARPKAGGLKLALEKVALGDFDLFLLGIAGKLDDLHAVAQRPRDGVDHVGSADEHHPRQIERNCEIVVAEG